MQNPKWQKNILLLDGLLGGGGEVVDSPNARQEGVGVKKPRLSHCGLVSGCNGVAGGEEGCHWVTAPALVLT